MPSFVKKNQPASTLASLNHPEKNEVEIDCSRVQHVGSSGIGKMLLLYKHLAGKGGKLRVVNLPGPIYELFTELKMDTLFTVTKQG